MSSKKTLVTGATGSTGREIVRLLIEKGHSVRALVHRKDKRSDALEKFGVETLVGDLLDFDAVTQSLIGFDNAYFCYPIRPGLIHATSYFAQAAKEADLKAIVNMSQISARRDSNSHAAQDHWIAERIFEWSGVPVTHIRPTFFAEWLLYVAPMIGTGVMRSPLFPDAHHAPVAAEDQAKVIANILDNPEKHAGKIYPLYGAKELTQNEIAATIGRVLGKPIRYEQVHASVFVQDGLSGNRHSGKESEKNGEAKDSLAFLIQHLEEVALDHKNGLFSGTNDVVSTIGNTQPLDVEQFVQKYKAAFNPAPAADKLS